jgi:preprotein translocase subunit SecY
MTTSGERTCFYSFLTTAFLVGLYWLGQQISLPGINEVVVVGPVGPTAAIFKTTIFMLGYKPFVVCFIVVELLSLVLPVGRRIRRRSSEGRKKLNKTSIAASLMLCAIQALAVAIALEKTTWLVPNPGWRFRLLIFATLVGGAIFVFCIANLISRWGVANGFCVLIAADILSPTIRQLVVSPGDLWNGKPIVWFECLVAIVVVRFLIAYYRRTATAKALTAEPDGTVNFDLPTFPQGILPLIGALEILSLPAFTRNVINPELGSQVVSFWIFLLGTAVLIVLIVVFSALGLALFSSKKRLAHNLPSGIQLNDDIEQRLRNQVIKSTAVLAGGSAILLIMEHLFGHVLIIGFANLIFLSAVSLDAIEQMRFSWKHSRSVELIELDNPHLASYLKGLFELRRVDVVFQTYHYRRLYFFFGPLTKMRMLIASEDVELARKLLDLKSIQII